jgi:hypothetical protein
MRTIPVQKKFKVIDGRLHGWDEMKVVRHIANYDQWDISREETGVRKEETSIVVGCVRKETLLLCQL